jgi:hypothetical protein
VSLKPGAFFHGEFFFYWLVGGRGIHYVRGWDRVINRPQRVEGSGITDVWQQLSDDVH